jgi:NADH:ubiquinone oxidoreductase subunit 3 (subunit A)
MTYECGEQPIGHGQIQFHVQFYLYAIIFVIFDIVTVFLMIWALVFSGLSDPARWYMIIFLGLLLIGVTYALKKEKILWIEASSCCHELHRVPFLVRGGHGSIDEI